MIRYFIKLCLYNLIKTFIRVYQKIQIQKGDNCDDGNNYQPRLLNRNHNEQKKNFTK